MHFLYVDESGDTGSKPGASRHFILCGLLVHHSHWHQAKAEAKAMRFRLEKQFGLPARAEIHASELLSKNAQCFQLPLQARLKCAIHAIGFIRESQTIRPIRAIIEKSNGAQDVFAIAWQSLLSAALIEKSPPDFESPCDARGLVIVCDDHRTAPRSRFIEALPTGQAELVVDLPFGLDSKDSDFLQPADLSAYLTKQELEPSSAFKGRLGLPLLRRNASLYR